MEYIIIIKSINNMTKEEAYQTLLEFATAFVDYELQTPEDYVTDDGQPTTAAEVMECLKVLPKSLPQRNTYSPRHESLHKSKMTYMEWLNNQDFKDYIYTVRKEARESINPNYRYCVFNEDIDECYLTDDIGVAMEFAANKSKADTHSWRVCNIIKAHDGSYTTTVEGHCMGGHYIDDGGKRIFLHFDYISQRCEGNIKKI